MIIQLKTTSLGVGRKEVSPDDAQILYCRNEIIRRAAPPVLRDPQAGAPVPVGVSRWLTRTQ